MAWIRLKGIIKEHQITTGVAAYRRASILKGIIKEHQIWHSGFLPPHQSPAASAQAYLHKTPRIIP